MVHAVDNNQFVEVKQSETGEVKQSETGEVKIVTGSINMSQLLDFSINIYNIEKYINVGQVNEILKYTNISFLVLLNMKGVEEIYSNDNLMMHILENCSDPRNLFRKSSFNFYSLNIVKKIIDGTPENFLTRFNLNIYYRRENDLCHAKLIYVLERCLMNDVKDCNDDKYCPSRKNIYEYCWNIYLRAHSNRCQHNPNYSIPVDVNLIVKLRDLFKKINVEERVFDRVIYTDNLKKFDVKRLKTTPYLKVVKPELNCSVM